MIEVSNFDALYIYVIQHADRKYVVLWLKYFEVF